MPDEPQCQVRGCPLLGVVITIKIGNPDQPDTLEVTLCSIHRDVLHGVAASLNNR